MVDRTTYKDLVEEILDELLLERSRSQQSVKISPEKLGHKVSGLNARRLVSIVEYKALTNLRVAK